MLRIIIADASLELIPQELEGHPVVRKVAKATGKKPNRMIYDGNRFAGMSKKLHEGDKRGRPDIVHYMLLNILETPLCREGLVDVMVHTRDGNLIRFRPDTRLPRGEDRFQGLMAKVLSEGKSQDEDPLIWSDGHKTPTEVLDGIEGPIFRLDETGREVAPHDIPGLAENENLCLVIGGFQAGAFSKAWQEATPESLRTWPEPLSAWTIAAECVAACRTQWRPSPREPTAPQS